MKDDNLREKAVLTAVEAMQRNESYFKRAQYVQQKFNAEAKGEWVCIVKHCGEKAQVCMQIYNLNRIYFRVGTCEFDLWQSHE